MTEQGRTYVRPRARAWGNEAQRAVLHAIAEDIARRSGYRVAAVEVLRSDGNLEFVAIAGSPEAREQLLGRAAPLAAHRLVAFGTEMHGWWHIPEERMDDETRAWMAQYGHTPDLGDPAGPDAWHAEDRLVRLLEDEAGELRATLYLDEPLDGLRPTPESIAAVNAEVGVMYDAVLSIVERERFGEQVRMLSQARTAMQSVAPGQGVDDFLRQLSEAMAEAMPVDSVDVLLAGEPAPELEPDTAVLEDHMRQVWQRRGHLVVELTQTWGIGDAAQPTPEVIRRAMERRRLGSWLLVPIGMDGDYLGTMGLGRRPGGSSWVDSEIIAASAVASDVAGVVVGARLMARERLLNAELRSINDYRRDMVLTLAHELRNPVSVLWTHVEMLGQLGVFGPIRESLAAMDRATRRIEAMVEDLMALATVSDTGRDIASVPVDLTALVQDCAEFLAATAAQSGVHLELGVAEGLVVTGEEAGLQRLVTNLLSNAIKYTPSGGRVELTAAAEVVDGRDGVRLTCTDTGIGIAASEVDRVFTPFFRSSSFEARKRSGTGLGLAIVERVAKRHHGTVGVESVLGEGTTFTVWLPAAGPADVR
ncbi:cell wall metabolism sensor histidine kinase WalK [Nocardioides sp. SYSU D00065]|uniref:sensor histidine kinase n=1 Tax=Nocardioides sp. SYSU D00065 TaxID=2817378 RepID=UPI001B3300CE|nr:HAMP domain-containing sensor histidine kinase [Nocardioides sp. SYSU D00065]